MHDLCNAVLLISTTIILFFIIIIIIIIIVVFIICVMQYLALCVHARCHLALKPYIQQTRCNINFPHSTGRQQSIHTVPLRTDLGRYNAPRPVGVAVVRWGSKGMYPLRAVEEDGALTRRTPVAVVRLQWCLVCLFFLLVGL